MREMCEAIAAFSHRGKIKSANDDIFQQNKFVMLAIKASKSASVYL